VSLTWAQQVDQYVHNKIGGATPHSKLKQRFTASDLRAYLKSIGHPAWSEASMFLQSHKYQMRWGTTDYMLRCVGRGPGSYWVVDDFDGAQASMANKIDTLSREHVNDILCRAKRMAEGNHTVDGKVLGGTFVGDTSTVDEVKRQTRTIVASWNVMRSLVSLPDFDFTRSWNRKHVTTV
jgi:hypothetical protein